VETLLSIGLGMGRCPKVFWR